MTGAIGQPQALAPWQTRTAPATEVVRPLSEGEGDMVIASAIAAHEMRKP